VVISHKKYNFIDSFLSKIFDKYTKVLTSDRELRVYNSMGLALNFPFHSLIDFPIIIRSFFWVELIIKCQNETTSIRFSRFSPIYHKDFKSITNIEEITQFFEENINSKINFFSQLAINEYLRDSSIPNLDTSIIPLINNYISSKSGWDKYLSTKCISWLEEYKSCFPLKDNAETVRNTYERRILNERKSFYDKIESNPLTEEQRLSVIRDNDRNMVLAAAGTGKTSVMVAKALDLLANDSVDISEILILAYNNAAAKELRERVVLRSKYAGLDYNDDLQISTFHSLGRKILGKCKVPTHMSVLAEDTKKFDKWVYDWLISYISSSSQAMNNFIAIHFRPADPFEFKTNAEYERFIRDNEYRSLNGDLVRGYQELLISNWLYLNGIEFEYEARYVTKVRIDIGYDYKPDFHISNSNIYIEHFGIDRKGGTRADIDAVSYNASMRNKRVLHKEHGTHLIETYHYDWCENNLEKSLEHQLSLYGIKPSPISDEEKFEALNKSGVIDNGAKVLQKSLKAIRAEQLNASGIIERLNSKKIPFADKYAEIFSSLHDEYVNQLSITKTIDFDDMIIRASKCVSDGYFSPRWKHVLIDEFQDISGSRMDFIKHLINKGPTPRLTVVGDDWQAIYRFSGGKLELTTRFADLVGSNTLTKLQKTFRYNNSIADTAGTFIMENDEQYKKYIKTHTKVYDSQVYLLDSKINSKINSMPLKTIQIIKKIREKDPTSSIAILSRYNYLIKETKEEVNANKLQGNVKFWTFHGSKGLEADYCILIGFAQGKTGFPNENKEDEVVEALLPSLDSYPYSEERRLFYVALTRAKQKSYIIADPTAPSDFINELISPKYDVHIVSDTFKEAHRKIFKCPCCSDGYFKKLDGKFGDFYVCSSKQACLNKPRVCKSCGSPSIDNAHNSICRNPYCGNKQKICPKCARPMALRDGKFGQFYGCSGYGLKDDQCKQTVRV